MKSRSGIVVLVIVAVCLILLLVTISDRRSRSLWPAERVEVDSGYREVMGTFARIVAVGANERIGREAVEVGLAQIRRINNLMSDYIADSELSRVNRQAFAGPVKVSDDLFEVLSRAAVFSKQTDGAFDVTIGPMVDLYRKAKTEHKVLSEEEINQAKRRVGFEKLLLDGEGKTVQFAHDGMRLDLGGIAKGYAIDLAADTMIKKGVIGGMVDIGGDIRCFGAPPAGRKKWQIGLQDPDISQSGKTDGNLVVVLEVINRAVATSGDYRRFVLIDGKKYSHIVKPATGKGASDFSSVTIICDNATDADAIATAVSVMGQEKGLQYVESRDGTEAVLISAGPEFKRTFTTGAEEYIK